MELNGCGRDKGCFRYCNTRPKCPAEEAEYMIAIETEESNENLAANEVLMRIGGYLNENKTVIVTTSKMISSFYEIYILIFNFNTKC